MRFSTAQPYAAEILVVDDGSRDTTTAVAQEAGASRVIRLEPNQGKGGAVRAGVLAAIGSVIAYVDADMNVAPAYLTPALEPARTRGRPGRWPARPGRVRGG